MRSVQTVSHVRRGDTVGVIAGRESGGKLCGKGLACVACCAKRRDQNVAPTFHDGIGVDQFQRMLDSLWRVLAPGGIFFCRLASSIGIEDRLTRLPDGKYRMPTGGEWLLAREGKLILATQRLGGEMVEPLKTVNVQNLRCMTTWVLRKGRVR